MINKLPESNSIDIRRLGRIFDKMSESYKIFWFRAIIDSVNRGKTVLTYDELINEMIASGWYMVSEYKLNLGPSDGLEKIILTVSDKLDLKASENRRKIVEVVGESNDPELLKMKGILTLHVPYRLQAPFLDDVKGKAWDHKNIAEIINSHNGLLYCFDKVDGLNSTIIISDDFAEYIRKNYNIVSGWVNYKMIEYLQKRNPSVPGIIYKLDPPQARKLNNVTKYWKEIIKETRVIDIYSDTDLSNISISIDHFVPWSYVAHDELWNLIPTTKNINSSKGNNLPEWDKYFNKLCELQYRAFQISVNNKALEKRFNKVLDEYVNDQNIRNTLYKTGQDINEFSNHLEDVVKPVYTAAKNLGFSEWQIKQ